MPPDGLRLVGHKGADLIAPGQHPGELRAAVEAGVDTIELDVLWLPDAHLPSRSGRRWSSPTTGTTPSGALRWR